jgi:hypothetical protein
MAVYDLPMVDGIVQGRTCGECQACCVVVGVHELAKDVWQQCKHQCDKGCAIYSERPESCRRYVCLWRAELLRGEENRPDKLGVICDWSSYADEGDVVTVWEVVDGAMEKEAVQQLLSRLVNNDKLLLILRRFNSSQIQLNGTAERMRAVQQIVML